MRPRPGHGLGKSVNCKAAVFRITISWTGRCSSAADVTTGKRARKWSWLDSWIVPNSTIKSSACNPASAAGDVGATASMRAKGLLLFVPIVFLLLDKNVAVLQDRSPLLLLFPPEEMALMDFVDSLDWEAFLSKVSNERLSPSGAPANVPSQFLTTQLPVTGSYFGFGLGAIRDATSLDSSSDFSGFCTQLLKKNGMSKQTLDNHRR